MTASLEDDIIEEREALMASATGGIPNMRIAHFLKPTVSSMKASNLKLPFLSPKSKWPLHVNFNGWRDPLRRWNKWVDQMQSKHHDLWKKAGILEAIMFSKYRFHINEELIFGVAERWCCDTNTFVFPWGEATVTLEDVMILSGFSTLGSPVFLPAAGKEVEEAEDGLRKLHEHLRHHPEWLKFFMESKRKDEHEAFLSLWLSRFVFPGNESDKIGEHVFPIAVNLSRGTRIALAPAVLASIYKDLSLLKESMAVSAELDEESFLALGLWAPLQLVQLWVWERLLIFRPEPNFLKSGEIRAARWDNLKRYDIGNVRPIIDSCGDIFLWRPYCLTVNEWSFPKFYKEKEESVQICRFLEEEVESFARCLRVSVLVGIDCAEPYQPHRVAMQFGLDQDLPAVVSRSIGSLEVAWINYSKPFHKDSRLYLPARLFESDLSVQYQKWWKQTVLVPVCSFQGVIRGQRSSRILCHSFSILRPTKVKVDGFANPSNLSVARLQNSAKVQIKVEANDDDVPPGFSPKKAPNSTVKPDTSCKNQAIGNGNDADVPPGFPPKPRNVAIKKEMKEEYYNSKGPPGFPCKNPKDERPIFGPEASAKRQHKEECVKTEYPDPDGFLPKNSNSQILSPESFTKKQIKEEDIGLKLPPVSALGFNSKLEQNFSPGETMPTYCWCQSIHGKAAHGLKPSSASQIQGKCSSTPPIQASEKVQNPRQSMTRAIITGNASYSECGDERKKVNQTRDFTAMHEHGGQQNCSFEFGIEILSSLRACLKH